jgi:hypothetical protein
VNGLGIINIKFKKEGNIMKTKNNKEKQEFTSEMKLLWNKDNSDLKYSLRGGRINLGCGWCGHNSPEG